MNIRMSTPYVEEEAEMATSTRHEVIVEMVHPDTLKFAPFNPPIRTSPRALIKLRSEIEEAGEIIIPLVVTYDNFVADGHRRLTIARELGYEVIPIIRKDYNLAELWSVLNGGIMPVNRKSWIQAVREGMPIECVPDGDRRVISDLIRVMGKKAFNKIVDDGRGPSIIVVAQYIAKYCGNDNDDFVRKIIEWFLECNSVKEGGDAVRSKCPPEILISAIENKRKINQYWGLAS